MADDIAVRCTFHTRVQTGNGPTYDYPQIMFRGQQSAVLPTPHPPLVGDLVHLYDEATRTSSTYRVIERAWSFPEYGSADWLGTERAKNGPILDIIVEVAEGPFIGEADES